MLGVCFDWEKFLVLGPAVRVLGIVWVGRCTEAFYCKIFALRKTSYFTTQAIKKYISRFYLPNSQAHGFNPHPWWSSDFNASRIATLMAGFDRLAGKGALVQRRCIFNVELRNVLIPRRVVLNHVRRLSARVKNRVHT